MYVYIYIICIYIYIHIHIYIYMYMIAYVCVWKSIFTHLYPAIPRSTLLTSWLASGTPGCVGSWLSNQWFNGKHPFPSIKTLTNMIDTYIAAVWYSMVSNYMILHGLVYIPWYPTSGRHSLSIHGQATWRVWSFAAVAGTSPAAANPPRHLSAASGPWARQVEQVMVKQLELKLHGVDDSCYPLVN